MSGSVCSIYDNSYSSCQEIFPNIYSKLSSEISSISPFSVCLFKVVIWRTHYLWKRERERERERERDREGISVHEVKFMRVGRDLKQIKARSKV